MVAFKVDALEELLFFKEEVSDIRQFSPSGHISEERVRHRTGPSLLGHNHKTILAPNRLDRDDLRYSRDDVIRIITQICSGAAVAAIRLDGKQAAEAVLDAIETFERLRSGISSCPFCPYNLQEQAKRHGPTYLIRHRDINGQPMLTDQGNPVLSFPNAVPYLPQHTITVFADHGIGLENLTLRALANNFKAGYQLAREFEKDGAAGVIDIVNFGILSGASVVHSHGHTGSIPKGKDETLSFYNEFYPYARKFKDNDDVMERLIEYIQNKHPELIILDKPYIFIYAAWAPKYPHHVEVIYRKAARITDLSPEDVDIAGTSLAGIFDKLGKMGVRDVNRVLHQGPFNDELRGFRMRVEIYNRNGQRDGAGEAAGLFRVINTMPEETAKIFREHYSQPFLLHN